MIQVFLGENSFAIAEELARRTAEYDGVVEQFDGVAVTPSILSDVFMGLSLFNDRRLVVIKRLSENKTVWEAFPEWLDKAHDHTEVIIVEPTLDKRTKTYKTLQKSGVIREFDAWKDRDTLVAAKWIQAHAKTQGLVISLQLASFLVRRVGVDQWQLFHAIEKLVAVGDASEETIEEVIEPSVHENIFSLFEAALTHDAARVDRLITVLRDTEDPYAVFGLLAQQAYQLTAVVLASDQQAIGSLGIHSFVVSKLQPHAKKIGRRGVQKIVQQFDRADSQLKSIAADPWLIVQRALVFL